MKILLIHDVQAYKQNGVSVSLGILADELKKAGHDVRILTLSDDIHSVKDERDDYLLGSLPCPIYPGIRMRLRRSSPYVRELAAWNPDVIHTNCEFSTFRIARLLQRKCEKRPHWVHTFHTDYRYYMGIFSKSRTMTDKVLPRFLDYCIKRVDVLIVPTVKIRDYILSADFDFAGSPYNTVIIPTGIDFTELAADATVDRAALRASLGVPHDAKLVIFLGRVSVEKNLEELVDDFAAYRKKHDDVYLLIVGSGPYEETLRKNVAKKGLTDRVIVHGGVPHDKIGDYYRASDVFASASVSETQGLTFYEAMYCGLPVLAKDRACLAEAVTEGENGAYFDDEASFEASLDLLLSKKAADGGTIVKKLPACFESAVFARSVANVYRDLLEKGENDGKTAVNKE